MEEHPPPAGGIDGAEALARLPHGPEFRFLDRVASIEPGLRGVGEYTVRGDEPFLAGHFPGEPIMPGVLLLEACAQLAGVVAQTDPMEPPLERLRLASVRHARFKGTVGVRDTVRIEAEVVGRLGGVVQARTRAHVGAILVLDAEVSLAGTPRGARGAQGE